jgi:hypothetical protein
LEEVDVRGFGRSLTSFCPFYNDEFGRGVVN